MKGERCWNLLFGTAHGFLLLFFFFSEECCGKQFKMWGRRRKEKEAATGTTSNPGAHSASSPEAAANTRSVTPQSQPRGGGTVSEFVNYVWAAHTCGQTPCAGVVRVSNLVGTLKNTTYHARPHEFVHDILPVPSRARTRRTHVDTHTNAWKQTACSGAISRRVCAAERSAAAKV